MLPEVKNVTNIVKVHNMKTNTTKEASAKVALKKEEKLTFFLQMYVHDYSNTLSNQFVRVILCE
jgi:hypothetical protein